jgi:hypothetical protein
MLHDMTKLEDIEVAVTKLSDEERKKLRAFLDELDWQAWDRQIERDGKAGKLDEIERRARENFKAGKFREI